MTDAFALFLVSDGTRRKGELRSLLKWSEADYAPWGVIVMIGGGLALIAGMEPGGLAAWLGEALPPLGSIPLFVMALAIVTMVVLVTEFASNVQTITVVVPVIA